MVTKICLLISSYEGSSSPFPKFDEYQDPSRYVSPEDGFEFTTVLIKKATAKQQLLEVTTEGHGFDYFWNFLWGQEEDDVAGIEAVEFLESIPNIRVLGTSLKYLKMGKLDFKKAASLAEILFPKYQVYKNGQLDGPFSLNHPFIIKQSNNCGSISLTDNSVCKNEEEFIKQMEFMEKGKVIGDILVEEFITGKEVSVMVIETGTGFIALQPLQYDLKPEDFLKWENKFENPAKYDILTEDSPLVEKIKNTGIRIYDYLGVKGSGYARVDFRVDENEEIYMLEVNHTPAFFSAIGNTFENDCIISKTFPGKHKKLVETIVSAKQAILAVGQAYDVHSLTYDVTHLKASVNNEIVKSLVQKFDFSGRVLDLGCGTGCFGRGIKDWFVNNGGEVDIEGIDLSEGMTRQIKPHFYSKFWIGLMENIIMELNPYDHIVSASALLFLDPLRFERVFRMMFRLAKKSITLTLEDIPSIYNQKMVEAGLPNFFCFNHLKAVQNSHGWKIVHKEEKFLWKSPKSGIDVFGLVIRFEKE